ncbi:hypothetical protein B0T18DRAFT_215664 [Schizothecium vesticola]|uniref:Uncharacterized protein n=1 Tax=Schizothecium vesticola TaxID=314040 RepID=A0AA40EJY1_9PEZI|nr:hypothetical protein B0T18DRAFT_215664 [Schizothecium vesticola]
MGFIFTTSPASCTVCAIVSPARRPRDSLDYSGFPVGEHEQSLMTKSRSSFLCVLRRGSGTIKSSLSPCHAMPCLHSLLRLWTNRASSMPSRQATDLFGRAETATPERETKTLIMSGRAAAELAACFVSAALPKSPPKKHPVNSGTMTGKQPESRFLSDPAFGMLSKKHCKPAMDTYLVVVSRQTTNPNQEIYCPSVTGLTEATGSPRPAVKPRRNPLYALSLPLGCRRRPAVARG